MTQFLFQPERIQDARSGVAQMCANIEICDTVAATLASTLGPHGLDKLFYGKKLLLTNDGATILENMSFKHPVAKVLDSLSKSQDNEVGDGTTSVVLLTSYILNGLKPLLMEGFPASTIKKVLKEARMSSIEKLRSLKIEFTEENLLKLAETSLSSRNVRNYKSQFAQVQGLSCKDDLQIQKIQGGSLKNSFLVDGVAFEKTFTYAGYEQQPKKIVNPKILCVNIELKRKSERENAELKISSIGE